MRRITVVLCLFFICCGLTSVGQDLAYCKMEAKQRHEKVCRVYFHDNRIYNYGLDTLNQIKFWMKVIKMSPDSGIINVLESRQMIEKFAVRDWESKSDIEKENYKDSIRKACNLASEDRIFFSAGKGHFYSCDAAIPNIDKAIPIFEKENTDPFYAQAILLIESPGGCAKSSVGAYGSFQIMRSVAVKLGLRVNRHVDERKDFNKSAKAAAKLIRTICIPYTNTILDKYHLTYSADDLWYRLLVLHVYHAGSLNVEKAVDAIHPTEGSIDLIKTLWSTSAGKFKNASQNYSQIALANLIELDQLFKDSCDEINPVYDGKYTIVNQNAF